MFHRWGVTTTSAYWKTSVPKGTATTRTLVTHGHNRRLLPLQLRYFQLQLAQQRLKVFPVRQERFTVHWQPYHTNQRLDAPGDTAAGSDTYGNGPRNSQVCVKIQGDDGKWEITLIKVNKGDFIDTIKEAIKNKCSPEFDSVPIFRIQLFKSVADTEPLDALEIWNPDVTWGTKESPLIVKAKHYPDQVERGKKFLESIMGDYDDIPDSNGMRVLRNVLDLETGGSINVVIRNNITEDFWLKVIDATETHRVCALGTPGIGKSTSTCILIRLLLLQNKTVIYRVRRIDNKGYIYMFTPTLDGFPDVKVIREDEFDYRDEEINKPSTYYVVDPGSTKDNCNLDADFKGKVIIVTSPDDGHWGGSDFLKARIFVKGLFMFLPVWKLIELLNAKDYFDCRLHINDIMDRYEHVGGIPRHIFTDEVTYSQILESQKKAINRLNDDQVRKMAFSDIESVQTLGKTQPNSLLLVFEGSNDNSNANFQKFTVAISSNHVQTLLVNKYETTVWSLIVSQNGKRGGFGWKLFETYCRNKMKGEHPKQYFDYKYYNGTQFVRESNSSLMLGGCKRIQGTQEDLIKAAGREEYILYYPLDTSYKFIDFIYRVGSIYYAFQVTVATSHSCNTAHLTEFAKNANGKSNFLLHYLTPKVKGDKFAFKPKPFESELFSKSNGWTINVVNIPQPDDDHLGPPNNNTKVKDSVSKKKLKARCRERGLLVSGNNAKLQQRLNMIGNNSLLEILKSRKFDLVKDNDVLVRDNNNPTELVNVSEKLNAFTVTVLKEGCRALGLPESGKKTELIQQLLDFSVTL